MAQYQAALRRLSGREPGFVSLEGYMVGRLVVAALEKLGGDVTQAGLLATIREVGTFDLSGIQLTYGPDDNQGYGSGLFTDPGGWQLQAVDRLGG